MSFVIRIEGDARTAVTAVRQTVAGLAPTIPLHEVRTIGLVISSWVGKLMSTMLYETSPIDPITYLSVSAVLALAAVAACAVPALRATRIEPQAALRVE